MPIPSTIQQEDYANFLTEASDLLQTIEQELFHLKQDHTPARVHILMRAAHTLKGNAASIQLETVKSVAHVLEDVFRVLYNPEVVIDAEIEALLFQAYECLRLPLMAEFTGGTVDEAEISERTATVLSQLQAKLGDLFDQETTIPTSIELGFDMVQSMFESGVEQRLQALEQALSQPHLPSLATQLQTEAEVFLGLAESLQLQGFGAIAQTTIAALATHPEQVKQIAFLAIADFRQGQAAILAGDRNQGGSPSSALQQFAQLEQTSTTANCHPWVDTNQHDKLEPDFKHQQDRVTPEPAVEKNPPAKPSSDKQPNTFLQRLKKFLFTDLTPHPEPAVSSPTVSSSSPAPPDYSLDSFFEQIQTESPASFQTPSDLDRSFVTADSDLLEPEPPLTTVDEDISIPISSVSAYSPTAPSPHPETELPPSPPSTPELVTLAAPPVFSPPTGPSPTSNPTSAPVVRVNLEQLERLDYLAGELLINQNQQTTQDEQFRLAVQELLLYLQKHKYTLSSLQGWSDLTLAINSASTQPLNSEVMAGFDALELDRYTDFHLLVQSALNDLVQLEMVSESLEIQIRQARQSREAQKRLLNSIQDDLTIARMQPLSDILNRLPRVLQQLATAHSKPVEMSLSGTAVLVDKVIAERLYNPLLHLVRNAFDHGIELPAVRKARGKPETGSIQIHAYHQGNRTFIEVRDDGQGIDWQRIAEKAIATGRISPASASDLSSSQLTEFLFQAGFSTASQVNDLSGRGVGLDMVQAEIQALKGTVGVNSTFGQGTTFTLSLPLSFSITRLMVCQHQGRTYALPMNMIQQMVLPRPEQLTQTSGQQLILHWQTDQLEQMIPVYTLSQLLNVPRANISQKNLSQRTPIILLQSSEGTWGLHVDQVIGEQELVIRPLGTAIAPPPYVYGCSILNDQQMALVIDPVLLQKVRLSPRSPAQPAPATSNAPLIPATATPSLAHVLLIEDSLTVRSSLARTLQQHGYRVSEAGDGLEAFASLQQDSNVHLIISDIEMPRMSGFEFLSQLRKTPTLQMIPVVMLTSRSGSKYRQFAANLGANAFVNKPSSAKELLPILDALINSSTSTKQAPQLQVQTSE